MNTEQMRNLITLWSLVEEKAGGWAQAFPCDAPALIEVRAKLYHGEGELKFLAPKELCHFRAEFEVEDEEGYTQVEEVEYENFDIIPADAVGVYVWLTLPSEGELVTQQWMERYGHDACASNLPEEIKTELIPIIHPVYGEDGRKCWDRDDRELRRIELDEFAEKWGQTPNFWSHLQQGLVQM